MIASLRFAGEHQPTKDIAVRIKHADGGRRRLRQSFLATRFADQSVR
jgi:hypothetical protein